MLLRESEREKLLPLPFLIPFPYSSTPFFRFRLFGSRIRLVQATRWWWHQGIATAMGRRDLSSSDDLIIWFLNFRRGHTHKGIGGLQHCSFYFCAFLFCCLSFYFLVFVRTFWVLFRLLFLRQMARVICNLIFVNICCISSTKPTLHSANPYPTFSTQRRIFWIIFLIIVYQ